MEANTKGQILATSRPSVYRKETRESQDVPTVYGDPEQRRNVLESPEWHERLRKLMQYRRQARVAQSDNRMDMAIDEDFYDGIQYDPEDLQVMRERNQAPIVYNVIKNICNWILGAEVQTRVDYRVLPRNSVDASGAKIKTKVFKYVGDVSSDAFERSRAFEECIKAGVGWLEEGVRSNGDEPLFIKSERWRNMWFDHLGTQHDCSDWRYVFREKWVDLDVAEAMFPERLNDLKVLAEGVNSLYPYLPDDIVITDNASEFDLESDLDSLFGTSYDGARQRVKMVEMWYRMPGNVKLLKMRDEDTPFGALDGVIFRDKNPDHQYLVKGGYASLSDAYLMTVRHAIWAGATYLQDVLSPYNHLRFPFIPFFCYRRKRDNMPYGVIRDLRDPQSDINKRRSRSLFILSANQVIYEQGTINDPQKFHTESMRADGMMEVNTGALQAGRIKRETNLQLAEAHVKMAIADENFLHSIAGVTYSNEGKSERDLSGKAIQSLQKQGQISQGVMFDNYYHAFQLAGEIRLSNIEQFYDQRKELLISGENHKDEFLTINEMDEDGNIVNSITRSKARFIVSKQDFRESIRLQMFETLSGLIQNLSKGMPEVALALLDQVIDFMDDLPNKDEMVARIRKINRQQAPDDEMKPEEKEQLKVAQEQQAQDQAMAKQLQAALAQAQISIKQAEAAQKMSQAMKNQVDAQMARLEGFLKAIEAAGAIQMNPAIVNAADKLIEESSHAPVPKNGGPGRQMEG